MTLKTLLLGSATAFAVVGGAQAADLSVAEPVDYVRICDAFGTGYWYIPGTDTCLKIAGNVEFDIIAHDSKNVVVGATHSSYWEFVTSAGLSFNAKTMTQYGELGANIPFTAAWDNTSATSGVVKLDKGTTLWLGPLTLGYQESLFDLGGGFADNVYREDLGTKQIMLAWALSGFGIAVSIEDPRDRWGSSLATSYSIPDIVAKASYGMGIWNAEVAAIYTTPASGGQYGVNGDVTVKLDMIAAGDKLRIGGAYGSDGRLVGGAAADSWSAYVTLTHYLTSALSASASFAYLSSGAYQGGANLVWVPVTGLSAKIQGTYAVSAGGVGTWGAKAAVVRSF